MKLGVNPWGPVPVTWEQQPKKCKNSKVKNLWLLNGIFLHLSIYIFSLPCVGFLSETSKSSHPEEKSSSVLCFSALEDWIFCPCVRWVIFQSCPLLHLDVGDSETPPCTCHHDEWDIPACQHIADSQFIIVVPRSWHLSAEKRTKCVWKCVCMCNGANSHVMVKNKT